MSVSRKSTPTRQPIPSRRKVSEIPYSLAFSQYGSSSQNCLLSSLDDFMTALAGNISIGFWFKGGDKSTVPAYIFGPTPAAGNTYCLLGLNKNTSELGKINLQLRDNTGRSLGVRCNKFVLNNKWQHAVITKDNTNTAAGFKFYINSIQEAQTTLIQQAFSDPKAIGRGAMLGSTSGSTAFFKGLLTQFGLWKKIITQAEVNDWYKNNIIPSDPYRYFPCDTGAMTNVLHESVASDNGTLDSVNMWSDQSPRGGRKSANLLN